MRYNKPFQLLRALLISSGICPQEATNMDIAQAIIKIFVKNKNMARQAYCGVLLIPGREDLRFCPLLKTYKQAWGSCIQKYADFWDPMETLKTLARGPFPITVKDTRDRLIIAMRFIQLFRSVDLARTLRTASVVGRKHFVLVMRKGKRTYQWERIVSLPRYPAISPWHLLRHYVKITAKHCREGTQLMRSLNPPYEPLTANTIGSLTKKLLKNLGIPEEWSAHSTRGAEVTLYKALGLTSEEVCEIGQWKNVVVSGKMCKRLRITI